MAATKTPAKAPHAGLLHRRTWRDFFAGGDRAFDLITVWMNAFCGLYAYSYWRVIELSRLAPPREMTAGLVIIVLSYIVGDKLLASKYLKAITGGYEPEPQNQTNIDTDQANVAAGSQPTVNQTPNNSGD